MNNDITHADITLYNSYSPLDWMLVESGRVGVDTGGGTDFKVDPLPLGQLIVTLVLHHVIPMANSFRSQLLYGLTRRCKNKLFLMICVPDVQFEEVNEL